MGDSRKVPHFLTAKTPDELHQKMTLLNKTHNTAYIYRDISFDGKQWVAWYLRESSSITSSNKKGEKV